MVSAMSNKPTPEQLDAIVQWLREARRSRMPVLDYDRLCANHMPAILDALEAKDEELKAARAAIGYYGPNPTKGHGACCECTVCTYLAKYGNNDGGGE